MSNRKVRRVLHPVTWALFAIPSGLAIGWAAFRAYGFIFDIPFHAKVHEIGLPHVVTSLVISFVAFLGGMSVGGWVWSRAARYVFRFTKPEIEAFLVTHGSPKFWNRINQRAIDKLYAGENDG